jgi:hypothetical protein
MTSRTRFSALGTTLEWYDFAQYLYLALVLGRVFFPSKDWGLATPRDLRGVRGELPDAAGRGALLRPVRRSTRPQDGAPGVADDDDRADDRHRRAADVGRHRCGSADRLGRDATHSGILGRGRDEWNARADERELGRSETRVHVSDRDDGGGPRSRARVGHDGIAARRPDERRDARLRLADRVPPRCLDRSRGAVHARGDAGDHRVRASARSRADLRASHHSGAHAPAAADALRVRARGVCEDHRIPDDRSGGDRAVRPSALRARRRTVVHSDRTRDDGADGARRVLSRRLPGHDRRSCSRPRRATAACA